jgi:3-phosphoshikimate 1-carboxyvinyltransferase
MLASLGHGRSVIENPLDSLDARSCAAVFRGLGATVDAVYAADRDCPNPAGENGRKLAAWRVTGTGGAICPGTEILDVGNSGTTLFLACAAAALGTAGATFTGDEQIRRRSAAPLLEALSALGAVVTDSGGGCAPLSVRGPLKGGRARLPCPTSQYLSALLLACPLGPEGTVTELEIPLLNEKPYIDMTLSYLDAQGIPYTKAPDYSYFRIPGGAAYTPVPGPVPGDFSSAAFIAAAGAVAEGSRVTLLGLHPADTQGDKVFFEMLSSMGADVDWEEDPAGTWRVTVSRSKPLGAGVFDLNACPDLLPIMAVTGAYAEGETALVNAAHARIKETDRIAVMAEELGKLGVAVRQIPDGLIIRGGKVGGGAVHGHGDHRVVMALAVAALGAEAPVALGGAESADVTYPGFLSLLNGRNGRNGL